MDIKAILRPAQRVGLGKAYMGCFALCGALLLSVAGAVTTSWVEYPYNAYGYGGDAIDASSVVGNTGLMTIWSQKNFYIAAQKTYIVKSKSGIGNPVTITSADQITDTTQLWANNVTWPDGQGFEFMVDAMIDFNYAYSHDSRFSQKESAIFLTAQPYYTCSDGQLQSGDTAGGQASQALHGSFDSLLYFGGCSGYGLPTYVQAVYTHGIRGGF